MQTTRFTVEMIEKKHNIIVAVKFLLYTVISFFFVFKYILSVDLMIVYAYNVYIYDVR